MPMHVMAWVECWVDCSYQWDVLCCCEEQVHCLVEGVLVLLLLLGTAYYLRGEEVLRQEILSLQTFYCYSYHHHCLTLRGYQWKRRSWKACH